MRYEIDEKYKIIDFYIEDDYGKENHEGLLFSDVEELFEEILEKIRK